MTSDRSPSDTGVEVGFDEVYLNGTALRDLPHKNLPAELRKWFDAAMKHLGLKNIGCHYISNKAARKACPSLATVDQFGAAYTDQHVDEIALIENDSNRDDEKYTIVHELLHFVLGPHTEGSNREWDRTVKATVKALEERKAL